MAASSPTTQPQRVASTDVPRLEAFRVYESNVGALTITYTMFSWRGWLPTITITITYPILTIINLHYLGGFLIMTITILYPKTLF